MSKAEKRLLNNPSTPLINLKGYDRDHTLSYLELCRDLHGKYWNGHRLDLIRIHKGCFGRQAYCWNGEYRNWVWEFQDNEDILRIFINNTQGISVEVTEHTPYARAAVLFERYKARILGK